MVTRLYNKKGSGMIYYMHLQLTLNIWMLPATEQLHPEQSENHNEEEEQEEEADDGLHGAHQRHYQVS